MSANEQTPSGSAIANRRYSIAKEAIPQPHKPQCISVHRRSIPSHVSHQLPSLSLPNTSGQPPPTPDPIKGMIGKTLQETQCGHVSMEFGSYMVAKSCQHSVAYITSSRRITMTPNSWVGKPWAPWRNQACIR